MQSSKRMRLGSVQKRNANCVSKAGGRHRSLRKLGGAQSCAPLAAHDRPDGPREERAQYEVQCEVRWCRVQMNDEPDASVWSHDGDREVSNQASSKERSFADGQPKGIRDRGREADSSLDHSRRSGCLRNCGWRRLRNNGSRRSLRNGLRCG